MSVQAFAVTIDDTKIWTPNKLKAAIRVGMEIQVLEPLELMPPLTVTKITAKEKS